MNAPTVQVDVGTDIDCLADEAERFLPDMWSGATIHDAANFVVNHKFDYQANSQSLMVYVAVLEELVRRQNARKVSRYLGGFVARSGAAIAEIEDRAPVFDDNQEGQMNFAFLSTINVAKKGVTKID